MKISISISAAFLKGQRVAVRVKKDEWYCGKVTTVTRTGGYRVDFNDGDWIKVASSRPLRAITAKGKQSSYTDVEIQNLFQQKPTIKPKPTNVPKPAKPKTTLLVQGIQLETLLGKKETKYGPTWELTLFNKKHDVEIILDEFFSYVHGTNSTTKRFYYFECPLTRVTPTGVEQPLTPSLEQGDAQVAVKTLEVVLNNPQHLKWTTCSRYFRDHAAIRDKGNVLAIADKIQRKI